MENRLVSLTRGLEGQRRLGCGMSVACILTFLLVLCMGSGLSIFVLKEEGIVKLISSFLYYLLVWLY